MQNPFHYGAPVTGASFVGRQGELEALVGRMRSQVNVVVMSPRRYGKTSLLLRAEEVMQRARPAPAMVSTNVFLCKDLATLAGRLVGGAYQVRGARWHRARQAVVEFLRRIRVRPAVELDERGTPRFSFSPSLAPADGDEVISDVYRLLAAESASRPAVLILDEFQAITRHGQHLPFLLKALSDEHPGVSLVMAGSQRRLLERLLTEEGAPLYGMAQRIALGPIPEAQMAAHLERRAAAGGKSMSKASAMAVIQLAGPVPNDVQHLAFEAFEVAGPDITAGDVTNGMRRAVEHESNLFAERVGLLSPGQVRVLMALASGPTVPVFSSAFAREVGLASGPSVRKAIEAMAENEMVVRREGRFVVADPFLAAWLRGAG
ncbi:MAG: AAA family ATPase [Acidimicrobiales bacterium]